MYELIHPPPDATLIIFWRHLTNLMPLLFSCLTIFFVIVIIIIVVIVIRYYRYDFSVRSRYENIMSTICWGIFSLFFNDKKKLFKWFLLFSSIYFLDYRNKSSCVFLYNKQIKRDRKKKFWLFFAYFAIEVGLEVCFITRPKLVEECNFRSWEAFQRKNSQTLWIDFATFFFEFSRLRVALKF